MRKIVTREGSKDDDCDSEGDVVVVVMVVVVVTIAEQSTSNLLQGRMVQMQMKETSHHGGTE